MYENNVKIMKVNMNKDVKLICKFNENIDFID